MKKMRLRIMTLSLVLAMLLSGCGGSTSEQEIVDPSAAPVVEGTESAAPTEGKTEQAPEVKPSVAPETEKEPEAETETAAPEGEPEKEPETAPEAQPEQGAETTDTPAAEPEKEPEQPAHEHKYDSTVIAATCEAGGYTLHQCACGEQYKDAETKATGHTYQSKVTAPTCTKGGYTTYTCACGDSRTGDETKATGHKYGQKIIAPTTQAEGYTLNTCAVCGDSYKSDIVDKLPEASAKPEDNKSDDFENTQGEGKLDQSEAGVFYPHSSESAPVYNGSTDYNAVVNKLNGYIFDVYGLTFYRNGLGQNDNQNLGTAKIVQNADGKFGITIIGWRHSYDSSATVNTQLNAVLEAFYYFTGSKDVAYRLWSVVDSIGINGASNTSGATYGFTETSINSTSAKLTYGSYEIVLDWSTGENTFWFK